MKKVCLLVLFATLLACSSASAQWQTSKYSIPIGRGGGASGFNSATPGAANSILTSSGPTANPVFSAFTTVINAACTVVPVSCATMFGYWRPEWFGAQCSISGTVYGSVFDSTNAIRAAIVAAKGNNGGTVQLSPCSYKITAPVGIDGSYVTIRGVGYQQTTVLHNPSIASPAFYFSAGSNVLFNVGISDLTILGVDTTLTKIAINFVDVSQAYAENILIAAYPDGTLYRGGSGSIGIQTNGRELSRIENVQIYAEQPLRISVNPNALSSGEDVDSWVFRNLVLVGERTAATRHLILADSGVAFYNTHFEGHQNWIGGVDGFRWINGGSIISEGLYISGVKDEQAGASGGYTFNVQQTGSSLYSFSVSDSHPGVRNAFFLRGVVNTTIRNIFYDPNTSPTKIGMNANLTNNMIDFRACIWGTGTLATMGAFTPNGVVNPGGFSAVLPSSGVLYQ